MSSRLFLLFSHELTAGQKKELSHRWGIVHFQSLPEDLQQRWSNVPPDLPEVASHVQPILNWLQGEAKPGDLVLIQGDFGATYTAVSFCFRHQLVPIYATSKREHREEPQQDGSVVQVHRFNHVQFREYKRSFS